MPTSKRTIEEVTDGIISEKNLHSAIQAGSLVELRGRKRSVVAGSGVPVKVNTNIGLSDTSSSLREERRKLEFLSSSSFRPDLIMDHTISPKSSDFWREMVEEFDGPVGTLPHYTIYDPEKGIDGTRLIDRIEEMLAGGVAFMTLHPTADRDIYEEASRFRKVPVTSRGGGLLLRDVLNNGKNENEMRGVFAEIAKLFKKYEATISVGTVFRPANTFDALDEVHVLETQRQIEVVKELKSKGVNVIMEGVGHVPMNRIQEYIALVSDAGCPFMPLGPLPTDSAIGFDHLANAIGGSFMAFHGGAHILNSITREEHTGGVPSYESCIEGLKAARVAAHSVNRANFSTGESLDRLVLESRAKKTSCVVSGGLFGEEVVQDNRGCTRCSFECPLILAPSNPIS